MGAKICLILSILLCSSIVFAPVEVMARAMLQQLHTAEETKSESDAPTIAYDPLKNGTAIPPAGKPYTRPCKPENNCDRPGVPPAKPYPPIRHGPARLSVPNTRAYNPLRPGAARPGVPRGKPYTRPCTYKGCKKSPGAPPPSGP